MDHVKLSFSPRKIRTQIDVVLLAQHVANARTPAGKQVIGSPLICTRSNRTNWCGTGGSPPFYGNCIYGANNQLRDYTAGRYLHRFMVATQYD